MKRKWVEMYLDLAVRVSLLSRAKRLRVGSVFVGCDGVISIGINGMPAGGSNVCEVGGVTKPEVSHAEENMLTKLLRQGISTEGGRVFITHAPCINCAKLLANCGIKEVWYLEDYVNQDGVEYMNNHFNIRIRKF